jgi:hypothetical protein
MKIETQKGTTLGTTQTDAQSMDNSKAYADTPTHAHLSTTNTKHNTHKTPQSKRNPPDFVYANGFQVKSNPTLGAGVVKSWTNNIAHINIKSLSEQHTIN